MGKVILRKILAAIIASAVVVLLAVLSFPKLITGIQLTDGTPVTANNFLSVGGFSTFFIVLFVVAVVVVSAVNLVGLSRRRRSRSSNNSTGTAVESDKNDGRERGTVKWFNMKKGFGFITWERGRGKEDEDVFVHFRSIRGSGYRTLSEGQKVKFLVVLGEKGPQAEDVSAVK